jgi:hypothetical protein
MKRLLLTFLALTAIITIQAQVAHWVVPPIYDVIKATGGQSMVIVDSANTSMLMTTDGRCLVKSSDVLHPVGDDIAVTTTPSTTNITGYYTISGQFRPLQGYHVAHNHPVFSEGNLLVKQGTDYLYLDVDGKEVGAAAQARPFYHGFSACQKYPSLDKRKNSTWCLITGDMQPAQMMLKGNNVSSNDIDFISSVNGEGLCLVILKGQLYLFSDADWTLKPIPAKEGSNNAAKLIGNIKDYINPETDTPITLKAKGQNADILIGLNEQLILQSIKQDGHTQTFPLVSAFNDPTSHLTIVERDGKKGISYNGTEVLAPQFEDVELCANNRAAVTLSDRCGIISVNPNAQFEFSFNNGNGLAFRHQKLQTTLRLDAPAEVPLINATLQSPADGGCLFDLTSKKAKDTPDGNALQYNCTLTIPDGLPDDITDVSYPVQVVYEGLISAVIPCPAKAWHYKYFTINVHEDKSIINNGNLTFTFNIKAERRAGEKDVPHTVSILSGNHKTELTKISESLYRCQVYGLQEGINTITVQVTETGCPPSSYPFEVTYNKAKAQQTTNRRPVKIENKTKANPILKQPAQPQKPNRPHLDI